MRHKRRRRIRRYFTPLLHKLWSATFRPTNPPMHPFVPRSSFVSCSMPNAQHLCTLTRPCRSHVFETGTVSRTSNHFHAALCVRQRRMVRRHGTEAVAGCDMVSRFHARCSRLLEEGNVVRTQTSLRPCVFVASLRRSSLTSLLCFVVALLRRCVVVVVLSTLMTDDSLSLTHCDGIFHQQQRAYIQYCLEGDNACLYAATGRGSRDGSGHTAVRQHCMP